MVFVFSGIYNNYGHAVLAFKLTTPSTSTHLSNNQQNVSTASSSQSKVNVANEYQFLRKWGSEGDGNGQFNLPISVTLDSSGNVYVSDYYNNRIQGFAPSSSSSLLNQSK